jgi:hypothetical protein
MKQEDVVRRKEEEAGSINSSTDSVNNHSGSGTITKFVYCLDGTLGEGNV